MRHTCLWVSMTSWHQRTWIIHVIPTALIKFSIKFFLRLLKISSHLSPRSTLLQGVHKDHMAWKMGEQKGKKWVTQMTSMALIKLVHQVKLHGFKNGYFPPSFLKITVSVCVWCPHTPINKSDEIFPHFLSNFRQKMLDSKWFIWM